MASSRPTPVRSFLSCDTARNNKPGWKSFLSTTHATDTGSNGNTVYQMLFDWQDRMKRDNNTYFAILEIDPEKGTLSAKAYSPMLNKWKTDPRSQFEFKDVKFLKKEPASKAVE